MTDNYTEVCEKTGNRLRGWHRCYGRNGNVRRFDLELEYEYNGIADGPYNNIPESEWSPERFVDYTVDTLKANYSDLYEQNIARLYWSLTDSGEAAPFVNTRAAHCNFLAYYTWPIDVRTGKPVNWFSLPVNARVPELEVGLGYMPAPLQPTVPIRTIVEQWQHTNGQVPWMFDLEAF
jgi:hypothetical protein